MAKLGSKLAKNLSIFPAISRATFLARNISQNHFPFSRKMREMCQSTLYKVKVWKLLTAITIFTLNQFWHFEASKNATLNVLSTLKFWNSKSSKFIADKMIKLISRKIWMAEFGTKINFLSQVVYYGKTANHTKFWPRLYICPISQYSPIT